MNDEVEYGMSKHVSDARIISLLVEPHRNSLGRISSKRRAGVDYLIRVMINGKYYVGELELSE